MSVVALKPKVKKEEGFDLNSLLDEASTPTEASKGKKSGVPVIPISVKVQELATQVKDLKISVKDKTTELDQKSEELRGHISPLRDNLCKSVYQSSVKVLDTKKRELLVSWSDAYSAIPIEQKAELTDIVKNKYSEYFEEIRTAKLKDMTDEGLNEFIKILGPENFKRFLEVKREIKPTSAFNENQFKLSDEQRTKLSLYVKQNKASIK